MIKRDNLNLIGQHSINNINYFSMGDSCCKTSINSLWDINDSELLHHFVLESGQGVRHPIEELSNDPRTFTRDQLLPLIAGLYFGMKYDLAKKVFWSFSKRLFIGQNILNQDLSIKPWYSGRDLLHPGHIMVMAKAARIGWIYLALLPIGSLFLYMEYIFGVYVNPHRESNQTIALLAVAGKWWLKKYCSNHPDWRKPIEDYYNGWRDQKEIGLNLIRFVESKITNR